MAGLHSRRRLLPRWALWILKGALGAGLVGYMLHSGRLDLRLVVKSLSRNYGMFAAGILLTALVPMIGTLRWRWLLRMTGMEVSFGQVLRLTWIGAFFNTFLPGATGGDILKAYGAAAAFPQRRPEAVLSVVADRLVGLMSLAFLALVVVAVNLRIIMEKPLLRETALILGTAWGVAAVLIVLLMSRRTERLLRHWFSDREGTISRALMRMDHAISFFRNKRLALSYCMAVSLAGHLCAVGALYLGAGIAGEAGIGFGSFLFLTPMITAINGIPLSPGGVGQGEGFAEVIFKTLNSPFGAEAFLVFRLMMTLAWMAGGIAYLTGTVSFSVAEEAEEELEHQVDTYDENSRDE